MQELMFRQFLQLAVSRMSDFRETLSPPHPSRMPHPNSFEIVALIDVLGARVSTLPEAESLLTHLRAVTAKAQELLALEQLHPSFAKPDITVLGDTIVCLWRGVNYNSIISVPMFCQYLFIESLMTGKFTVRGAVALGDFIRDEHVALGPGIADAASWYAECDMMGIVATPQFGLLLDEIAEIRGGEHTMSHTFVRYPVPLKNGSTLSMWTVAWPWSFITMAQESGRPARQALLQNLRKLPIPKGTETKYEHAKTYFDWYLTERYGAAKHWLGKVHEALARDRGSAPSIPPAQTQETDA